MAPWTHTYLSPQTERRMCCASREPAQNFQQYIDTAAGTNRYLPMTLEQHWNSEHMRSVRRRMMAGEILSECEVCNDKLLNTNVYRDYFNHLFGDRYHQAVECTDDTGYTTMQPVSWDYRFSNLCNFKCRTCGDMLSSAWESEERQHAMINWEDPKNAWMKPGIRKQISQFQDSQIEQEFSDAVEQHRVEEIYWVGGEPLMYEQHWRYMQRIIDLGDGPRIYARYNTNLSRVQYQGTRLYSDILDNIRDWQICASLDGTGPMGEYLRDGLDYQQWVDNYRAGLRHRRYGRQMRIDFTLTLPGLLDIDNIVKLSNELDSEILAKVIFSFTPDIILSPLSLPRDLLCYVVQPIIDRLDSNALRDVLQQLLLRPTFQEQWPESWSHGLRQGKRRLERIDALRKSQITLDTILSAHPKLHAWYHDIH